MVQAKKTVRVERQKYQELSEEMVVSEASSHFHIGHLSEPRMIHPKLFTLTAGTISPDGESLPARIQYCIKLQL